MSKFTFICEEVIFPKNDVVSSKRTVEFNAVSLLDVIAEFEMFLKGNGFVFDGVLDIITEDEQDDRIIPADLSMDS
jgi:hypothetical protein